ncbi:50S ribosomal protein L6 [Candidatus Dependentiae bacterium]|nr:50S ribosomal protein L6 [Candidatus Dependentiae bacterium]
MSKIGRKPIALDGVSIEIKGNVVDYKGKKSSGSHELPEALKAEVADKFLTITCKQLTRENKMLWGMHRAILANEIKGSAEGFKQEINITGLGFKAAVSGKNIVFSLGYSHKINFVVPEGVNVTADKTGQLVTVEGPNKELVGLVSSQIRALRPPEPYKGTGIKLAGEVIIRKAGKTKAA